MKLKPGESILFVFCVSLILCTLGIWSYPIYILDESKNAEAAREMLFNLDFIVPRFNDVLRTDKPPLHYFFMVLGYNLFGVNELGARFFSSVFGALTFTVTFFYIRKFSGIFKAWLSVFILWSSIFFVQEFHLAVPDPYLIFFISSGLWLFYDFSQNGGKSNLFLMYVCFSLGFLTKGPIAIVLPLFICLSYLFFTKSLKLKILRHHYKLLFGVILFLIIVLPWYILVHLKTDGLWTQGFFLDHNINRFGNEMEGHGGIFLITWAFVLLGLMPFSFFIFNSLKGLFGRVKQDRFLLFSVLASGIFILFFSVSGTKLPNYTMPSYPFLVYILADCIYNIYINHKKSTATTITLLVLVLIAVALPVAGYFALSNEKELSTLNFYSFWLIPTAICSVLGFYFYWSGGFKKAFVTIALGWMLLNPILFLIVYPALTDQSPVVKAQPLLEGKEYNEVIVFRRFDAAFPINYNRTYRVVESANDVEHYFKNYPNGMVLTNSREYSELLKIEGIYLEFECKALFESHTTRIFRLKNK